jgi:hypothetical protein
MNSEAYQNALTEATIELREIVRQFEQLRTRKELIEKLVDALQPVVGSLESAAVPVRPTPDLLPVPIQERFDNVVAQGPDTNSTALTGETLGVAQISEYIRHNGAYFADNQSQAR